MSAIHELARQILAIDELQDPASGVTLTVGVVRAARAPTSCPPKRARRSTRGRSRARCRARRARDQALAPQITGATHQVTGIRSSAARTNGGRGPAVRIRRRRSPRNSASTLEEGSAGGGSDGNFTAALGVPTLDGFGAIGDGAHAIHEHVEIDALVPRAATIAGVWIPGPRSPIPRPSAFLRA